MDLFHRFLFSLRHCLGRVVIGGILFFFPMGAVAQAQDEASRGELKPDSIEAIDRVRVDADGNASPDRVSDTVTVAGRVFAGQDSFILSEFLFLQDETGGIAVRLPQDASVQVGDSLQVRGVLEQSYGLTQIEGADYRVVEGARRSPSPVPLTVAAAHGEKYEGQIVRVRGRVARKGSNDGGEYLLLEDGTDAPSPQIALFIPHRHTERIQIEQFESGDEIRATGALAQFDTSPPHTEYYQVWPRTSDDLEQVGGVSPYVGIAIALVVAGGLLAVLAVVTLRMTVKHRTRELAQSRARFRRLAEATSEGIIVHDDGEILDTNEALTQMIGREREDLVGQHVAEVLRQRTQELTETGFGRETEAPREAVVARADGTSFPVEIEERTVEAGNETMHVAALRDISERKKREAEILLAKEEAEQMARLKSSLLNNMSHELRTPITSIIGYAEVIVKESEGTAEEFAGRIRRSGKRLADTLRAVLELAQLEAGALSPNATDVTIKDVAAEVVEKHAAEADGKDLSLDVEVREDCILHTDRTLVYRILSNLVHNAIKFTDQGSVRITAEAIPSGVQIAVRDTGVGIHQNYRAQLFEPFTQESKGRGREYEGIGIGLTLTKRMVELLGGDIAVESTKEEGSIFTVILPPFVDEQAEEALAEVDSERSS